MRAPAIGGLGEARRTLALLTTFLLATSLFLVYAGTAQAVSASGDEKCYETVEVTQYRYEKQVKQSDGTWVRASESLQFMGPDEWSDTQIDITNRPAGPWTLGVPKQLGDGKWYMYVELTRQDSRQVEIDCRDVPGHCPDGLDKIELPDDRVSGMDFTADKYYEIVVLVGGPPNENNQDPDGRNKYFYEVEPGQTVSREAHEISHVCVKEGTTTSTSQPTTTSTTEPTTTSTTEPTTTSTTEPTTTSTTEPTTTTTEPTTTSTEVQLTTTTTEDEVLPTIVTTTTIGGTDLPLTGARADVMFGLAVVMLALGLVTLTMTRRLED